MDNNKLLDVLFNTPNNQIVKKLNDILKAKKDFCIKEYGRGSFGKVYKPNLYPDKFIIDINGHVMEIDYVVKELIKIDNIKKNFLTETEGRKLYILENDSLAYDVLIMSILNGYKFSKIYNVPLLIDYSSCNNSIVTHYITKEIGYGPHIKTLADIIFTTIDTKLSGISRKKLINSLFMQVIFTLYFLEKNGINAHDIHLDNIFIEEVNENIVFNGKRIADYKHIYYKINKNNYIKLDNMLVFAVLGDVGYFEVKINKNLYLRNQNVEKDMKPFPDFIDIIYEELGDQIQKYDVLDRVFRNEPYRAYHVFYMDILENYQGAESYYKYINIDNMEDYLINLYGDYIVNTVPVDSLIMGI